MGLYNIQWDFILIYPIILPQAKRDEFAYYSQFTRPPQLNYSVCVSSNIKTLHAQLSQPATGTQGDSKQMDSLLTEPVYQIASQDQHLNETTVQNYTENIIALGFLKQGKNKQSRAWILPGWVNLDPIEDSGPT